jgi:hypothetical protein
LPGTRAHRELNPVLLDLREDEPDSGGVDECDLSQIQHDRLETESSKLLETLADPLDGRKVDLAASGDDHPVGIRGPTWTSKSWRVAAGLAVS